MLQENKVKEYYSILSQEEAVLKNEPIDNSYLITEPYKMIKFPYIFLGIIRCVYENESVKEISEGVGLLIGSDIVLTSAHNLCNKNRSGKILFPDLIEFIPGLNGIFQIFPNLNCKDFSIPQEFLDMKMKDENEQILNYDYGLVFLEKSIGEEIVKIMGNNNIVEKLQHGSHSTKINYNLYDDEELKLFGFIENSVNFFKNNEVSNMKRAISKFKISMVSYTKYHTEYLKCPHFKYNSSFNILNKKFSNYFNLDHHVKVKSHSIVGNKLNNNLNKEQKKNSKTQLNSYLSNLEETSNLNSFQYKPKQNLSQKKEFFNKNSQNYILFNDKNNINKLKFYDDDQLVLCEAKGKLCNYNIYSGEENESGVLNELRYLITTYGGQSGSPIFLRNKDKTLTNKDESDEYVLIGIHSRCPIKSFILNKNGVSIPEEDSSTIDINCERDSDTHENKLKEDKTNSNKKGLYKSNKINSLSSDDLKNAEIESKKDLNYQQAIQNSSLSRTALSDYNIGLKINLKIIEDIKEMIRNKRKEFAVQKENEKSENLIQIPSKYVSEYLYLNCYSHDKFLFSGIFHKNCDLINLFRIAESFIEIPVIFLKMQNEEEFISLDDKENFSIYNDKISDVIKSNQNSVISKRKISFYINIDKYGDHLARKLLDKLKDFDDEYEGDKLKKKEKVKIYNIIKYIFDEIQFMYNKSAHLHGLLFKTVRDKIFELCEQT